MKPDILTLICDPPTRDVLEIKTESDPRGRTAKVLVVDNKFRMNHASYS